MNPQPSSLSAFFALAFFFGLVLFYFIREINFPTTKIKNPFDIKIDKDDIYVPIAYVTTTKPQPKVVVKVAQASNEADEAISGLVNLGYRKKDAKSLVEKVIKEHNLSSAEDIIRKCFAK